MNLPLAARKLTSGAPSFECFAERGAAASLALGARCTGERNVGDSASAETSRKPSPWALVSPRA